MNVTSMAKSELMSEKISMKIEDIKKNEKADKTEESKKDVAAVYEKNTRAKEDFQSKKLTKEERAALVERLKRDTEERASQMLEIVKKSLTGQSTKFEIGTDDGLWKILARGDLKVDESTIKQAKEDISEDGYWGVKKTSERLFEFAKALAGDNKERLKEMQEAMKKGYKEATKAFGKELPEISKKTIEAADKLFEAEYNSK